MEQLKCKNCGESIAKGEFGRYHLAHDWYSCEGFGMGPPFGEPVPYTAPALQPKAVPEPQGRKFREEE